jgi:hypothetical protein
MIAYVDRNQQLSNYHQLRLYKDYNPAWKSARLPIQKQV